MKHPSILHMQVTERCNLACPGCYLADRKGPFADPGEIDGRVFAPMASLGVRFVTITGGEPLLHPELPTICAAAAGRFDEVQVVCNGVLLTPEMFLRLRDAGVTSVRVSLDGATAEMHDALRGRAGTFDALCANLRGIAALPASSRRGVETGAIMTVQPANVTQVEAVAALTRELGLFRLLLQPLHPFGQVYPPTGAPVARPSTDPAYLDALDRSLAAMRRLAKSSPCFLENSPEMLDAFSAFHVRERGPRQRCGVDRFVFVNSRLDVRGCLFGAPLDNLRRTPAAEIFTGQAWSDFQRFRTGCALCLMGCQFYDNGQRLTDRGFELLARGEAAAAERMFRAALGRYFSRAAAQGLAVALRALGHPGESARRLEELAGLAPQRADVFQDWAAALHADGRPERALEVLGRLGPGGARRSVGVGLVLRDFGRLAEAAEALRAFVDAHPGNLHAGADLCRVLLDLGRTREAVEAGERAVAGAPESGAAWHQYGLALGRLGRREDAARALLRALELDPASRYVGGDASECLRQLGRLDEALDAALRGIAGAPYSAHAHHHCGLALSALGRKDEALEYFLKAAQLAPDDAWCRFDAGMGLVALGDAAAAREHFESAARLLPREPWFRFRLGLVLETLGAPAQAREQMRLAAELAPGERRILEEYGRMTRQPGEEAQ